MKPVKALHAALGFGLMAIAAAEPTQLQVLQLHHRMADELIPIIKPLVTTTTTITGTGDKIIVRASQRDFAALGEIIAQLDRPLRRLMITVRNDVTAQSQGREYSLSGRHRGSNAEVRVADPGHSPGFGVTVGSPDTQVRYRTLQTRSNADASSEYRVQALEGRPAYIQTGTAVPVAEQSFTGSPYATHLQETVHYHALNSGFYVVPRLSSQQVTVEIYPYSARQAPEHGGVFEHQDLQTTASGKLGEWIHLGGVDENVAHDANVAYTQTRLRGREVWVRVEEL